MLHLLLATDLPVDYSTPAAVPTMSPVGLLIDLVVFVVAIAAMWKLFTKAGQAGWKSLIPFYNTYVMLQIAGKPGWWILLFFVPLVNIYVWFSMGIALAKSFGKSTMF